ncbi:hypothetical protein QL285_026538 [Trifolium repens]|nr:hypothetical protein QL285_026538 [Trifolium repens]
MASEKRHTPTLKIRVPQVESLKLLSDKMTSIVKSSFEANYGLILNLLHEKIDHMAIITLAQFYDPPLRCFTFQDFQLAPTLEEFAKILGCNLKDRGPYLGLGEDPTMEEIDKSLHLTFNEVSSWLEIRKNVMKGFPRSVLETKAQALLDKKDWRTFNAVLALLVYGFVLFPNIEDLVDFPAIGVFMARNPVSALLADFYHSLYTRHEKNRRGHDFLLCSFGTKVVDVSLTEERFLRGKSSRFEMVS